MITAMTFPLLAVLALLMSVATVRRMWSDGAGPDRPPRSHPEDPRFPRRLP